MKALEITITSENGDRDLTGFFTRYKITHSVKWTGPATAYFLIPQPTQQEAELIWDFLEQMFPRWTGRIFKLDLEYTTREEWEKQ